MRPINISASGEVRGASNNSQLTRAQQSVGMPKGRGGTSGRSACCPPGLKPSPRSGRLGAPGGVISKRAARDIGDAGDLHRRGVVCGVASGETADQGSAGMVIISGKGSAASAS